MAARKIEPVPVKCRWRRDAEYPERWNTGCGYAWWDVDSKRKNCPHCGDEIEEVRDGEER